MKIVCLIVIFLFLAWITIHYINLAWTNYCAKKYFNKLDTDIKKRLDIFAQDISEKTHVEWYLSTDDTNRKIALIKSICSTFTTEVYESFIKDFEPTITKYNKYARKLRKLTDVFPTSFMARLQEIKSYNEFIL
jgi:hypothetical protein